MGRRTAASTRTQSALDAAGPEMSDPNGPSADTGAGTGEDEAGRPFLPDAADLDPDADATNRESNHDQTASACDQTTGAGTHTDAGPDTDNHTDADDVGEPDLLPSQSAGADHAEDDAAAAATEFGDAAAGQHDPDQPPTSRIGTGENKPATPPGHLDGRPPDPPPDRAPAAAPDSPTGAAERCPDDDHGRGQATAAGPVWRAPRLPYEWAPLGSVPSDYQPADRSVRRTARPRRRDPRAGTAAGPPVSRNETGASPRRSSSPISWTPASHRPRAGNDPTSS